MDEARSDGSVPHDLATFGVPRSRHCEPDIGSIWKVVQQTVSIVTTKNFGLPRSATAPISVVICRLAYSHKQDKKSIMTSIACLPGCEKKKEVRWQRYNDRNEMAYLRVRQGDEDQWSHLEEHEARGTT